MKCLKFQTKASFFYFSLLQFHDENYKAKHFQGINPNAISLQLLLQIDILVDKQKHDITRVNRF